MWALYPGGIGNLRGWFLWREEYLRPQRKTPRARREPTYTTNIWYRAWIEPRPHCWEASTLTTTLLLLLWEVGRILESYANPRLRVEFAFNCLEFSKPTSCLDEAVWPLKSPLLPLLTSLSFTFFTMLNYAHANWAKFWLPWQKSWPEAITIKFSNLTMFRPVLLLRVGLRNRDSTICLWY